MGQTEPIIILQFGPGLWCPIDPLFAAIGVIAGAFDRAGILGR